MLGGGNLEWDIMREWWGEVEVVGLGAGGVVGGCTGGAGVAQCAGSEMELNSDLRVWVCPLPCAGVPMRFADYEILDPLI